MVDKRERLERELDCKAELIIGDINDTIDPFVQSLDERSPIGFVALDVDTYTATRSSLRLFGGQWNCYLPAVSVYLDDIAFYFAHRYGGELLAVHEFNHESALRKIDKNRALDASRVVPNAAFYERMFVCHVLDHAFRERPSRGALSLEEHRRLLGAFYPGA